MQQGLLIGLGSGLASALAFFSAGRGGPVLGHLLYFLTPLPPLLAGLGWGWLPTVGGALVGTLAVAVAASPLEAAGYLFAVGVPAALVAYLAYLSRPSPADAGAREWYPLGRLLAVLSLYAGALPVLTLPLVGGSFEALRPRIIDQIKIAFSEPGRGPSEQQIEDFADLFVTLAPSAIAVDWLLIMVANLYLAGRIADASGRLARPWPDVPALTYPKGFPLLLGAALLAGFAPGVLGTAGAGFTGGLLVAQLLAGLALVHFLARRGARWLLWVVYTGLLVPPFTASAAILVILAGLIEPVLKLKQRLGAPQSPPT
jgi:hypothetical protein